MIGVSTTFSLSFRTSSASHTNAHTLSLAHTRAHTQGCCHGAKLARTRDATVKTNEAAPSRAGLYPYVHLLKCKALAGPNIHPSYNPSVNRLWSSRLSWSAQLAGTQMRGGSCASMELRGGCMHNELHSQKKHRGDVITQRAANPPSPPRRPAFFLFVGARMCDGRALKFGTSAPDFRRTLCVNRRVRRAVQRSGRGGARLGFQRAYLPTFNRFLRISGRI